MCVTAPAQTPASIQLEALKKLTLVQLILYGQVGDRVVSSRSDTLTHSLPAADITAKVHESAPDPEPEELAIPQPRPELSSETV